MGLAIAFLILLPVAVVILLIGPVFVLRYRYPHLSLAVAILIFAGLIFDHLDNFDGVTYADISPWGVFGVPQAYLAFSLLVALGGIALAARSVLARL